MKIFERLIDWLEDLEEQRPGLGITVALIPSYVASIIGIVLAVMRLMR